jgi:hypothetical protein
MSAAYGVSGTSRGKADRKLWVKNVAAIWSAAGVEQSLAASELPLPSRLLAKRPALGLVGLDRVDRGPAIGVLV